MFVAFVQRSVILFSIIGLFLIQAWAAVPPAGNASFICWRPEDVELVEAGAASENVIRGVVRDRAYQGAHTELHVATGDAAGLGLQRLHVAGAAPAEGAEVAFRLGADQIRFVRGALA